jgi:hypothetical protein
MKTEGMQEALEQIHAHQDGKRDGPENWPQDDSLQKKHEKIRKLLTTPMVNPKF